MKTITFDEIDFAKAKPICVQKSSRRLYSLGKNCFLVCRRDDPKYMQAFEWKFLQEVIDGLTSPIHDVELSAITPLICRIPERHKQVEFEIRLYLKRGDIHVIKANEHFII